MRKLSKKNIITLVSTILILISIIVLTIIFYNVISDLFYKMIKGIGIVKEYILSLKFSAVIAMVFIMVFCYFFPFISSLPIQIVSGLSYGILIGTLLIDLSFTIASQLLYLLSKNAKIFYSKKRLEKTISTENKIKNSKRSIYWVMIWLYIIPAIPFLIISDIAIRSGMKWWKYTLFTTIGPIPEIIVTLLIGDKIATSSSPITSIILIVLFIALVILCMVFRDRAIDLVFKPKEEKKDECETSK